MSFAASELRALLSAISELHENVSMPELERKILTLEEAFLELQEENLDLRLELRAARESLQEKDTMKYETPFYFLFDGEQKMGPFCQRCYDVDGKKVHLIEHSYMMGSHRCNACDTYYGPPRDVAVESALDSPRGLPHNQSAGLSVCRDETERVSALGQSKPSTF